MRKKVFIRSELTVVILLLTFILPWLVSPPAVFSQDENPVFNVAECPETSGGYSEAERGHSAVPGFLNCNYHKQSSDNEDLENWKHLYITYYKSPQEAQDTLQENFLNDDHLKQFSCETWDDCDKIERVLVEQTEYSFLGYTITKSKDPENFPDRVSLEQRFTYGNYSMTIFVQGELFSGIDAAMSELEELELSANQLADEPREMVARESIGEDCDCDDPTEEPTEVSEAESSQDDTDNMGVDATTQGLAELIKQYGTDPEKLSQWPGWEGLTDTQRNTLLIFIDKLDNVLNAESPSSVLESQSTEQTTDPETVLLQAAGIFRDEFWAISTIINQFQIDYFQMYQTIKSDAFDGIDQHLIKTVDPVVSMFFPVVESSFEYSCVKLVSQNIEENNLSPEEIAQKALVAFLSANETQLPGVGFYKLYREEYDRIMNTAENATVEAAHQSAIEKINAMLPDVDLKAHQVNALFNLRQRNVPVPNLPVSGEENSK